VSGGCPGNQNRGGAEILSDKLAAIELTKFIAGLRSEPMTDQDVFTLYRECLEVIVETDTAGPAETDPEKIALALLTVLHKAGAVEIQESQPAGKKRKPPKQARKTAGKPLRARKR
jgi:hypothetical protein